MRFLPFWWFHIFQYFISLNSHFLHASCFWNLFFDAHVLSWEPILFYFSDLAFPHSSILNQLFLVILFHENSIVTVINIFKIVIKMLIEFSNSATLQPSLVILLLRATVLQLLIKPSALKCSFNSQIWAISQKVSNLSTDQRCVELLTSQPTMLHEKTEHSSKPSKKSQPNPGSVVLSTSLWQGRPGVSSCFVSSFWVTTGKYFPAFYRF